MSTPQQLPYRCKMASPNEIHTIHDRASHDRYVDEASERDVPTVIYVCASSTPDCKAFTPRYQELAERHPNITFCQMELSYEVNPMIKFSRQNCPILIVMRGGMCRTILGGDIGRLEKLIDEVL